MNKENFKCAYCGKEYDTPLDRANCEMSCGAKARVEEEEQKRKELEKQFQSRLDEVKSYYTQAEDVRKYADEMKSKLIADYPQKRSEIQKGLGNSNMYFVVADDENMDQFKKQFSNSLNSIFENLRFL